MEFLGENVNEQIADKLKKPSAPPEQHNFFAPMNELDPLTRPSKKDIKAKFACKVFYVNHTEDMAEYAETMNKIVNGEYTNHIEETFHDKDGNIKVFLKWLEWPAGSNPVLTPPKDEELDALMEADKRNAKEKKKKERQEDKDKPKIPDPEVNI